MSAIRDTIAKAPALWTGVVVAVLALAISYGAPITPDQSRAILGTFAAFLVLAQALITHQTTTPNGAVDGIVKSVQAGPEQASTVATGPDPTGQGA